MAMEKKEFQSFKNDDNSQNIIFEGMKIDKIMWKSELFYEEQSVG